MLARWLRRSWFYAREVQPSWPERYVPCCRRSLPVRFRHSAIALSASARCERVIHFLFSSSVGCEICGVRDWISHHWLIRHNNCCAGLQLVCELLGKLAVKTDSRSDLLGFDGPAFTVDTHPSAGLASRRELTWFAGAAFKQCENVTAETFAPGNAATGDLNCGASNRIAISINVKSAIGRA